MAKSVAEEMKMGDSSGDEEEEAGAWEDWGSDGEDSDPEFKCLFCVSKWASARDLFTHCSSAHSFDFHGIRKSLGLDFYASFKLINYVRTQVAENRCWSCVASFNSREDLQNHLHPVKFDKVSTFPWEDDRYLKSFMQDDALLHSFEEEENEGDDCDPGVDREKLLAELEAADGLSDVSIESEKVLHAINYRIASGSEHGGEELCSELSCTQKDNKNAESGMNIETSGKEDWRSESNKQRSKRLLLSSTNIASREIKNVNENYFGAYSSFGIHREMISDKVRTDSYRMAILNNPSLMSGATVMDVGCGTGILSLFAAQAGALRVYAVDGSAKMVAVATQIAKENGLLWGKSQIGDNKKGAITVVHSMVEELDKAICVPSHSVDVLVSEWMGYCLLYESMLSSVLYARDHWLKPGGAILPDIATMYVAGFGRGATSVPFWENVYGFDMSSIGKEVLEDAAQLPIVDVVNSRDIVTVTAVLKTFDLATMDLDDMDFTSTIELEPKFNFAEDAPEAKPETTWCYGIVVWFETAFSTRFCRETSTLLSTSPYNPTTHWSQTILTFKEPVAMTLVNSASNEDAAIGTNVHPAARIRSRISIARAAQHRSIDISMEITAISASGKKRSWPAQIFNL